MTPPKRTSRRVTPWPSTQARKSLTVEQRGRFWQSVSDALKARNRAKSEVNP